MPKDTELTQEGRSKGTVPDGQPVVYLVNADSTPAGGFDLQQLLAPIWRWRWVVSGVLLLTVLAAGWYFTRPAESRYQLVIESGSYPRSLLLEKLKGIVLPQALSGLPNDWSPPIEVGPLSTDEDLAPDDELNTAQHLISISFPVSAAAQDAHTMLLGRLRTALDAIAEKDAVIVGNQFSAEQSRLTRKVTEARDAYSRISEESYIAALRGRIDKEIQLTEASIRRQVALYEFQSQRNATLDEHADRVSSRLDELLATMGTTESTFPGTVQVLVDRITSLRLELEDRIPEERLQIERRINEGMAEQDRLAAILSQQKLEAQNFDADLAARQSVALDAIAAAESELAMLEAQKDARLVHQPTSIVEELTVVRPDDNRRIKTLAILVFGGLCSLLSAYALEALRLARLGTLGPR